MKILFPLTNPIIFDDTVLYQSYQDARNYQYIAPFQQKYKLTDRLTFQLKWKEKDYGIYYIKVYLVINGVSTFYRQQRIYIENSDNIYGMQETDGMQWYFKQKMISAGKFSGVFCLSMLLEDFATGYNLTPYSASTHYTAGSKVSYQPYTYSKSHNYEGTALEEWYNVLPTDTSKWKILDDVPMLAVNDCFAVKIEIENTTLSTTDTFTSNTIKVISADTTTKLLNYNQDAVSGDVTFDTDFSNVIFGYDLRLPAVFFTNQKADKEIFQKYDGKTKLISAVPYTVDTLIIGDSVGVPDWMYRNLNYILHCSQKKIDGVKYELALDSELKVENIPLFANKPLSIDLIRLDDNYIEVAAPLENEGIYVTYYDLNYHSSGYIDVITNADWYLSGSMLFQSALEKTTGKGITRVNFSGDKNLDSEILYASLKLYNLKTNTLIQQIIVDYPPYTPSGWGYMKIGSTFKIS